MLITPHTAAGLAIGSVVGNPLLVVPAAIASHFVLDAIPHWQETLAPYVPTKKTYVRIAVDLTLAIGITVLASHWQPQAVTNIWLGAIFANVSDLDSIVVLVPKIKRGVITQYWDWHCKIQKETASLWGLLPQLLVLGLGLMIVRLK